LALHAWFAATERLINDTTTQILAVYLVAIIGTTQIAATISAALRAL
jgi:hypothetical protein